ncbi:MAG: hypothetical protein ACRDST_05145 [Pseudonocardiaceae bacterium]
MAVHEISVTDKRERDRFITVERAAIADEPLAIREIAGDVHKRLQGRSPFFEEMEYAAFLAAADGRVVARCTAMIQRRWQRGADRVIAPFNSAAMHDLGTLTGAFDESPMFPFP